MSAVHLEYEDTSKKKTLCGSDSPNYIRTPLTKTFIVTTNRSAVTCKRCIAIMNPQKNRTAN